MLLLAAGCAGGEPGRPEVDVYVAGYVWNDTVQVARLWKNGHPQDLSDGVHSASATGVAVSGQDVYVSGGVDGGGYDVATLWKNGTATALTDGTSHAFGEAIAIAGGDVYVAGHRTVAGILVATLWKNGEAIALTDGTRHSNALAVAVSGADVYAAGWDSVTRELAPGSYETIACAVAWKNGVASALTAEPSSALAIAVAGQDVYVAGKVGSGDVFVATVWRNGVPLPLADDTYGSAAAGVAVSAGAVLVSGVEYDGSVNVAKLWRGGVPMDLTSADRNGAAQGALARAVAVAGDDVYAAGYHGAKAVYWKNGAEVALVDGSLGAAARAITLVPR